MTGNVFNNVKGSRDPYPDEVAYLLYRWESYSAYRNKNIDTRVVKIIRQAINKLSGPRIFIAELGRPVVLSEQLIATEMLRRVTGSAMHDTEYNERMTLLLHRVLSGVKYFDSFDDRATAYMDVMGALGVFLDTKHRMLNTMEYCADVSVMEYFWNLFAEPDKRKWVSSQNFCIIVNMMLHAVSSGRAPGAGAIDSFRILRDAVITHVASYEGEYAPTPEHVMSLLPARQ